MTPRIRGGRSAPPTGPAQAGRAGTGYYLSPAEKGGEPPGRWQGGGVAELGFREGQVIEREVFERLYGKFLDPRDPAGETRLGRAPQRFRSADEIYAVLAALEPEATAERRAQLMIEAKSQVRAPVQYFDATFSVSKSITLLHASAMANAARAAAAGDQEAAGVLGAGRRRRVGVHSGREPGGAGVPAARGGIHPVRVSRPAGQRRARRAGGRTRTGSWSGRSRSTPAGTATRSCTSTT